MQHDYSGVIIPMITPFDTQKNIDHIALKKMLHLYMSSECIPFILGTTGEAVSMSVKAKKMLLGHTVKIVDNQVPVFAGISDTCLENVMEFAQLCKHGGIDAAVVHLPAYYPITEQQISDYFQNLAQTLPLPLIMYNIPATTKLSIPVSVIEELSRHPNIIGLKDSERSLDRMTRLSEIFSQRNDFLLYSGWTAQSRHALEIGFDGIVPSTGNIIPAVFRKLYLKVRHGAMDEARKIQEKIDPIAVFHQKDKVLSDVISVLKEIMCAMDLCEPHVLSPLQPLSATDKEKVMEFVKSNRLSELSTENNFN